MKVIRSSAAFNWRQQLLLCLSTSTSFSFQHVCMKFVNVYGIRIDTCNVTNAPKSVKRLTVPSIVFITSSQFLFYAIPWSRCCQQAFNEKYATFFFVQVKDFHFDFFIPTVTTDLGETLLCVTIQSSEPIHQHHQGR